jgi:putative restriction endonuclease
VRSLAPITSDKSSNEARIDDGLRANLIVVRGYVGLTDADWYRQLHARRATEANFWTPSAKPFRAVESGAPFFFLLKKPFAAVCGFGIFAKFSVLPDWLAWEAFGDANGVANADDLRRRILKYRRSNSIDVGARIDIGCIVLEECVFFDEPLWVKRPADWATNIVSGKTYDMSEGEGLRLYTDCIQRGAVAAGAIPIVASAADAARYGLPTLVRPRLGQGGFRVEVTDAYQRACAVTSEHSLPVLEAAHIKPYARGGEHAVSNGLLLRTDIHRLFDRGYVTVDDQHCFVVSRRLREDFENGRVYYEMHGRAVFAPAQPELAPSPAALAWHRDEVFLG